MKHINKFAIASLMVANCSVFGATPAEGWYGGFLGGLTYTPNYGSNRTPDPFSIVLINSQALIGVPVPLINFNPLVFSGFRHSTVQNGLGGDFGGQIGYRLCNFRLEGELLYNYSPISLIKLGGFTIKRHVTLTNPIRFSGQTSFGAGLVNLFYDFYDEENDPTWVPYLGVGIGYSYIRSSTTFSIPYLFTNILSYTTKHTASTPMGQAILGISYYYSDYLSFGLDYRYESTKTLSHLGGRVQTNALNIGFNYAFAEN